MGIIVYIAVSLFASCCSFSACFLVLNLQIPLNSVHLLLGLIHLQHFEPASLLALGYCEALRYTNYT